MTNTKLYVKLVSNSRLLPFPPKRRIAIGLIVNGAAADVPLPEYLLYGRAVFFVPLSIETPKCQSISD